MDASAADLVTHAGGIFAPSTRAATQAALTANGATLFVRVVSNVAVPDVDALFAATTCSTADLGACQKLADDLSAFDSSKASNVALPYFAKLQAGTDPAWSISTYDAARVGIVED